MSRADHDRIYSTPGLPRFEIHELDERLLAGRNPLSAIDAQRLVDVGVTHVVDLREPHEWEAPGRFGRAAVEELGVLGVERLHAPVTDGGAPSAETLDAAVRWISRVAEQDGSRIFVHCRAGQERTAAVLAAYVATHWALTLDQAIDWLASRYGGRPLPPQEDAVREWLAPTALPQDAVYRSRVRGCLLGGAIGDALGAPIEFMGLSEIRSHFGPSGVTGYETAYGRRGAITDDTQMTLFTVEGIIRAVVRGTLKGICSPPAVVWHAYRRWLVTQGELADSEDEWLTSGWLIGERALHARRAPGKTCISALATGRQGTLEERLNDSKGCGGVMRVAPVGLCRLDYWGAFEFGCEVAALTHSHVTGYVSSGAMAFLVRRLIDGLELRSACEELLDLLLHHDGHEETLGALRAALDLVDRDASAPSAERMETLGQGWVAEEALAMGVYAALAADDVRSALLLAVNHSGDSDSTGAIAGSLLGAMHGVEALPGDLLGDVELRGLIVTLADDLVDVQSCDEESMSGRWWERYPGY